MDSVATVSTDTKVVFDANGRQVSELGPDAIVKVRLRTIAAVVIATAATVSGWFVLDARIRTLERDQPIITRVSDQLTEISRKLDMIDLRTKYLERSRQRERKETE